MSLLVPAPGRANDRLQVRSARPKAEFASAALGFATRTGGSPHLTPAQGSGPVTIIEIVPINSVNPEFYHFTAVVHFKVAGMTLKVSNTPAEPTK
jgi:hypothetical protein